jgi:uncharacterized coiled-coil protein SlyX
MKVFGSLVFILISTALFAQDSKGPSDDLASEMAKLHRSVTNLEYQSFEQKRSISRLSAQLAESEKLIDSLQSKILENIAAINQTASALGIKLSKTEAQANQKIAEVGESLSTRTVFGVLGVIALLSISGISFWLLKKRQNLDKSDLIEQLTKTKLSIEEGLVKEFEKQTELMDAQIRVLSEQRASVPVAASVEPDHSFALKVASEINLIERNISLMDAGTKGLKQLSRSVSKLKDNLAANGYEIPELLGKPFNQGMKVVVTSSIPDETLEAGVEIITKIIVPQVNYNDKMIQTAQIETSKGV